MGARAGTPNRPPSAKWGSMLTDRAIRQAAAPRILSDRNGLRVKISATSAGTVSRRWSVRLTTAGGVRQEIGLGSFPEVSLAEARTRAAELREQARSGADPLAERRAARAKADVPGPEAVMTFRKAAEAYLAQHEGQWSNRKHAAQWRKALIDYAAGLGPMAVAEIDTPAVLRILDPLWTSKPETARRVRQRIESVLDWAMARGYRPSGLNPARLKGNLAHALPRARPQRDHHTALPWAHVPSFWTELATRQGTGADALRFVLLTAARSGEVRGARWEEIDLDAAVWTVPASRMKARKEHRVPLSGPALELLHARRDAHGGEGLVFSSDMRPGSQVSDMTLSAVLRRMGLKAVPHGLRSSFRDWCAEATAYPREVAEQALAHSIPSAVEAAYRRGDMLEKRRRLMADWARYVTEGRLGQGDNVRAIRGAA
jgi:integrase